MTATFKPATINVNGVEYVRADDVEALVDALRKTEPKPKVAYREPSTQSRSVPPAAPVPPHLVGPYNDPDGVGNYRG